MTNTTGVEAWDTIPRDIDANDYSRLRGEMPPLLRADAERVTDLGGGMIQVDYVDTVGVSASE